MRQSSVPFYWSNLLFKAGNGSSLDTKILSLIDEGYFPGMDTADVTPQVFGDKQARTHHCRHPWCEKSRNWNTICRLRRFARLPVLSKIQCLFFNQSPRLMR